MAALVINGDAYYTLYSFSDITDIVFKKSADATFSVDQFDDTQISTNVSIAGTPTYYPLAVIDLVWSTTENFSAAFWSFNNIRASVQFHGSDGAETIVGSEVSNFFYVSGADTDYGSASFDTFFYSTPADVTAGQNLYGGLATNTLLVGTGDFDFNPVSLHDIQNLAFDSVGDSSATFSASKFLAAFTTVTGASDFNTHRVILNGDSIDISGVNFVHWYGSAVLNGASGDDTLTGSDYSDSLSGGDGNDQLNGGGGSDTLDGGPGNDTLTGGAGDDVYVLANLHQTSSFPQRFGYATVVEAADGGIDTVQVEKLPNTVVGSYVLPANVENGQIIGSNALVLYGNELDNHLTANNAGDRLGGGDGNDSLNGGDGADSLSGDAGNDTLNGGAGNDTLTGGAGDDVYVLANLHQTSTFPQRFGYATVVEAADGGIDTVQVQKVPNSVVGSYLLPANVENGQIMGSDAFTLYGNELDNHLEANYLGNTLGGGGGNDTLSGGQGADSLSGDAGNDYLYGGYAADTLLGGDGKDILVGGPGADSLVGGNGSDTADYSASSAAVAVDLAHHTSAGGDAEGDTLSGIKNLVGSILGDTLTGDGAGNSLDGGAGKDHLTGGGGNDHLLGGGGKDFISGGGGNDVLDGGAQSDRLHGDGGNDKLIGGGGADTLIGGVGADTLSDGAGNDRIDGNGGNDSIAGGSGDDTIVGSIGSDTIDGGSGTDLLDLSEIFKTGVTVNLKAGTADFGGGDTAHITSIETVLGGSGDDLIAGSNAANELSGNGGADTLNGLGGNDMLNGGDGEDLIQGGGGNDTLDGGGGADTLRGGAGADVLTGGTGNDHFDFNALAESGVGPAHRDTISDFSQGHDKIDLSTIDAISGNGGNDAFDFIGAQAFSHTAGELRQAFNSDGSATIISGDVIGNGSADFQIVLSGHYVLSDTDFIL